MKSLINSTDTTLPSGSPGQVLYLDISSDPVWQTPPDPGLTEVAFNDSPYLIATTSLIGRVETTQINLVTTGTGPNVLTSNLPETSGLVLYKTPSPEKITLDVESGYSTYTLSLPKTLPSNPGYFVTQPNGKSSFDVLRSGQYYATAIQTIPANGNAVILFPNAVTPLTAITYSADGTFTLNKNCVAIITTSIPFTSTSARRCVFIQKNTSVVEFGEQCVNDIPGSIESISATTILNFVSGDTFKIRSTTTTATATTFSTGSFAHVQVLLL